MTTGDAVHLLGLVSLALDEFERDPLPASVRRALRVARLNGDELELVRFTLELDFDAGRALGDGPAHDVAYDLYLCNRAITVEPRALGLDDGVRHTTEPLDLLAQSPEPPPVALSQHTQLERHNMRRVVESMLAGVRAFTWDYLARRETELRLSTAAERIFTGHRARTDRLLGDVAPVVLETLNAALERARHDDPEARAHALTSCRRVLTAVADAVFPARAEPWCDGAGKEWAVGPSQYRNRLVAAVASSQIERTRRRALCASLDDFASRVDRLDELTNKGVHGQVSDAELRHAVIHTYLLAGEILELYEGEGSAPTGASTSSAS